jgi:predicted DNA-binding protein YlxM (UPF0122 family)
MAKPPKFFSQDKQFWSDKVSLGKTHHSIPAAEEKLGIDSGQFWEIASNLLSELQLTIMKLHYVDGKSVADISKDFRALTSSQSGAPTQENSNSSVNISYTHTQLREARAKLTKALNPKISEEALERELRRLCNARPQWVDIEHKTRPPTDLPPLENGINALQASLQHYLYLANEYTYIAQTEASPHKENQAFTVIFQAKIMATLRTQKILFPRVSLTVWAG